MDEFTAYMSRFCSFQRRPYDLVHANFWMSGLVAAIRGFARLVRDHHARAANRGRDWCCGRLASTGSILRGRGSWETFWTISKPAGVQVAEQF